jgi:hypothetical protein
MTNLHTVARIRFKAQPSKCYQRHIREVHGELADRLQISNLSGAIVEAVSRAEAESIVLRYEWLGTVGQGASAFYGLKINGELLGVACFGVGGSREARNICGPEYISSVVCLMRGACVPWAPKNAASFLIRNACYQASQDRGWKMFFAYSDPAASEIGTVYQAANWFYLGQGIGRRAGQVHLNWLAPDGTVTSSNAVHKLNKSKRDMFAAGYKPVAAMPKRKYVWFEGTPAERRKLKSLCRYPFLDYPKRPEAAA